MNSSHRKTLESIFARPVSSNLDWRDIENLFRALGAVLSEGSGSRVRVELKGIRYVYHRPHPGPKTTKGAVESVREQLVKAGVKP